MIGCLTVRDEELQLREGSENQIILQKCFNFVVTNTKKHLKYYLW